MEFIFTAEQEAQIITAIQTAESHTTGEIRLHVEPHCKDENLAEPPPEADAFERALAVFSELGMHRTKLQNGVLFYLAYTSHKFAIVADVGINSKVPTDFWEGIKEKMEVHFKKSAFVEGLSEGILAAGQQLKTYFPADDKTNSNELSDDISKA
jgi:uncharacterized membrane protein